MHPVRMAKDTGTRTPGDSFGTPSDLQKHWSAHQGCTYGETGANGSRRDKESHHCRPEGTIRAASPQKFGIDATPAETGRVVRHTVLRTSSAPQPKYQLPHRATTSLRGTSRRINGVGCSLRPLPWRTPARRLHRARTGGGGPRPRPGPTALAHDPGTTARAPPTAPSPPTRRAAQPPGFLAHPPGPEPAPFPASATPRPRKGREGRRGASASRAPRRGTAMT